MFNFFGQRQEKKSKSLSSQTSPDSLNETTTRIAIELIEGQGGRIYLNGMKRIFRRTPELINDVAQEYREPLRRVLEQEDS